MDHVAEVFRAAKIDHLRWHGAGPDYLGESVDDVIRYYIAPCVGWSTPGFDACQTARRRGRSRPAARPLRLCRTVFTAEGGRAASTHAGRGHDKSPGVWQRRSRACRLKDRQPRHAGNQSGPTGPVDPSVNENARRSDRFARESAGKLRMGSPRGAVAACLLAALAVGLVGGCDSGRTGDGQLEEVWELRGISPGRLQKPRAMAIDGQDRLYIVDMTARIQVFDTRDCRRPGQLPSLLGDPREGQWPPDRPLDRPRRPRSGGRHALLPGADLLPRGRVA